MTNEEAIKRTDYRKLYCNTSLNCDCECEKCNKAESMVIEALEKQIPKKPIYETRSLENEKIFGSWCPSCKRPLSRSTEQHHCKCGQAIDWSEDND